MGDLGISQFVYPSVLQRVERGESDPSFFASVGFARPSSLRLIGCHVRAAKAVDGKKIRRA